jgi:hypothetical protein
MAAEFIATIQRWIGLSTDEKPTATKAGSTFHEIDTGKKYIWFNDAWYQDLSMIYAVYQASLGMPESESS